MVISWINKNKTQCDAVPIIFRLEVPKLSSKIYFNFVIEEKQLVPINAVLFSRLQKEGFKTSFKVFE